MDPVGSWGCRCRTVTLTKSFFTWPFGNRCHTGRTRHIFTSRKRDRQRERERDREREREREKERKREREKEREREIMD